MGFTLCVQRKLCLLTGVPVGCLSRLSGADGAVSTINQQQTPVYLTFFEVYLPAVSFYHHQCCRYVVNYPMYV